MGLCKRWDGRLQTRPGGGGERGGALGPASGAGAPRPRPARPPPLTSQLEFLWRTFLSLSFTWCPLLFLVTGGPDSCPSRLPALPSDPPTPSKAGTYSGAEPASSSVQGHSHMQERRTGCQRRSAHQAMHGVAPSHGAPPSASPTAMWGLARPRTRTLT